MAEKKAKKKSAGPRKRRKLAGKSTGLDCQRSSISHAAQ